MKIHFIGIGGIGISALAQFCLHRGNTISGSEMQETNTLPILRNLDIPIFIPQQAKNIPEDCDLVVYTEAIINKDNAKITHPEYLEAKSRGILIKTYFEYLGEISHDFRTIAIAGTHGKTTTTGLISAGFLNSNFNSTIFVGSILAELNHSNFQIANNFDPNNSSNYLLLEACEYRNNFKFIQPEIIVLTNAELDHIDYYRDEAHYIETFQKLAEKAKIAIFHEDDVNVAAILKNFSGQKIVIPKSPHSLVQNITLSGKHNRQNAALAFSLGEYLAENTHQDFDLQTYNTGVKNFTGAARRQEFLGDIDFQSNTVKIFDDYGHHPTEISATIQSFREKFPHSKLGLIFEPHQHSRTRKFFTEFQQAFTFADFTGIFPIYAARDTQKDIQEIKSEQFLITDKTLSLITDLKSVDIFLEKHLNSAEKLNDPVILLFMGAGKIDAFAHQFLAKHVPLR